MPNNKIKNSKIGGSYHGGDDNSTNNTVLLDAAAFQLLHDKKQLEKFSLNAQKYIADVATKIMDTHDVSLQNQGFDFHKLQEKFKNVKSSADYKENFNQASVYFHAIDEIRKNDSIHGGENTILCIVMLITQMYYHFFPKYENGDCIHSAIFSQLIDSKPNPEEMLASNILIFYTVKECGIFNEKK